MWDFHLACALLYQEEYLKQNRPRYVCFLALPLPGHGTGGYIPHNLNLLNGLGPLTLTHWVVFLFLFFVFK